MPGGRVAPATAGQDDDADDQDEAEARSEAEALRDTGPPRPATQMLPPLARAVAEGLLPAAAACGWQFAVIRPERAGCGPAPGVASGAAE